MAYSEKNQTCLDKRLQAAHAVLKNRGESGATAKELASDICGKRPPDICQRRQMVVTLKAMAARNMARILGRGRKKDAKRWVAVDSSQWMPVEAHWLPSAKNSADKEQHEWMLRVKKEAIKKAKFREKMANRL
jgi:hypothetical protein